MGEPGRPGASGDQSTGRRTLAAQPAEPQVARRALNRYNGGIGSVCHAAQQPAADHSEGDGDRDDLGWSGSDHLCTTSPSRKSS